MDINLQKLENLTLSTSYSNEGLIGLSKLYIDSTIFINTSKIDLETRKSRK